MQRDLAQIFQKRTFPNILESFEFCFWCTLPSECTAARLLFLITWHLEGVVVCIRLWRWVCQNLEQERPFGDKIEGTQIVRVDPPYSQTVVSVRFPGSQVSKKCQK